MPVGCNRLKLQDMQANKKKEINDQIFPNIKNT